MFSLDRRDFLRATGAGLATLRLPLPAGHLRREFAGEEGTPALVVLFLRGGVDALHALVPYGDPRYYEFRPTLAVAPEDAEGERGVIPLDGDFGLHPALAGLLPFWTAKRLAAVVAVGSPHPTRSHFDAQDFMEYAAPGLRTVRDGWLNRYLTGPAATGASSAGQHRRGLALHGLLPRSLRGRHPALAVPEASVRGDGTVLERFAPLYGGSPEEPAAEGDVVVAAGRTTLEALAFFRRLAGEADAGGGPAYPDSPLAQRLRVLARILRAGAGGRIHGAWPGLRDADLYEGRDLPVTTDFRDVLAAVLRAHFRFDVPRDFFPGHRPARLKGLFG
ncbi:MAG: hypothetical protein AB1726_01225 [Planctomycetota bacterium]